MPMTRIKDLSRRFWLVSGISSLLLLVVAITIASAGYWPWWLCAIGWFVGETAIDAVIIKVALRCDK
jgi:hypothetical protein